jgi:CheY-like chemotaxis protein
MNPSTVQALTKPCSILVLDDDPTWRCFIKSTLEFELKTTPLLAASGREALQILAERPIDVVVSDLQMPVMDGFQFLKRARVQSPSTKVIIISAAFEPLMPAPSTLTAAGALAIVSKLDIDTELVDLLRRIDNSSSEGLLM